MSHRPPHDPLTARKPEPPVKSRLLWPANDWADHREAWVDEDHGGTPEDPHNQTGPIDTGAHEGETI